MDIAAVIQPPRTAVAGAEAPEAGTASPEGAAFSLGTDEGETGDDSSSDLAPDLLATLMALPAQALAPVVQPMPAAASAGAGEVELATGARPAEPSAQPEALGPAAAGAIPLPDAGQPDPSPEAPAPPTATPALPPLSDPDQSDAHPPPAEAASAPVADPDTPKAALAAPTAPAEAPQTTPPLRPVLKPAPMIAAKAEAGERQDGPPGETEAGQAPVDSAPVADPAGTGPTPHHEAPPVTAYGHAGGVDKMMADAAGLATPMAPEAGRASPALAPATDTAPTVGTLPHQIGHQMAQAHAAFPGQPVEITLTPEELGKVTMVLDSRDGTLTLAVQAERAETLDLMRRHADQLAQDFRDMGFQSMRFSFGGDRRPGQPLPAGDQTNDTAPDEMTAAPPPPSRRLAATGDGRIDLRL